MNLLFKSPRARRGISPVIATVLIIAVTVSAAAVVWVIVNNQLDDDLPTFAYEVQNSLDFNNDNKIDLLELKVRNLGSKGVNTTYVSNDDWFVIPGFNILLNPNEEAIIKIGTNSINAQFEAKEKVRIGVGPFDNQFKIATLEVSDPVVPVPTTVSVSSGGEPLIGLSITFLNDEGLPAAIPPVSTDNNGQVVAYLLPDYYVAKTSSGQQSERFHNVLSSQVTIGSSGEKIHVTVIDDLNHPIEGIIVYDADTGQNDLGAAGVTDNNGVISFIEVEGTYLFRANYLGINYWSSSVTVPGSSNVTIKLTTNGELIGQLLFGGAPAGKNKLLRLYTSTNASMGKYDYTNASSFFEFTSGVSPGVYRLRLDYQNNRYWSGLVSTSDPNLEVDFGGGNMNILVTAGSAPLPKGVLTRLYTSNNVSAGRYDYLNASGVAEYSFTPAGAYRLRIDWLGKRTFTSIINHQDSSLVTINIGGGPLNVLVTASGAPLPKGVLTRLYNANNVSAGRYDYLNTSGWAEYGAIPEGDYRLRVDWLGQRIFTEAFPHDGSPVYRDIGGGNLRIQILAGSVPLPNGVLTRLYNANNVSAGRYDYVNSTGWAEYGAIPEGDYRLRIDWLGQRTFTSAFSVNSSNPVILNIPGASLTVKVLAGGTPLPNGVLTRLYLATNVSVGRYDYLNSSGFAEYGVILSENYRLRIDWLGQRIFTTSFNVVGSGDFVVDIGGGALNVRIEANGVILPNGVLTRLYNDDGTSTGRYDYLNGVGLAEYGAIPDGSYKLRIDWLGRRIFTSVFVHDGSLQVEDLGGGLLKINVEVGVSRMPNGVLTRLYLDTGTSTGRYDYLNGTGTAEYGAIPAGSYKLRIDWMGQRIFTTVIVHNGQVDYTVTLDGEASMILTVQDNSVTLGSGKLIKLYNGDGTYTGRYTYTDGSGQITFTTVPAGIYYIRYDNRNSDPFTAASPPIPVNIP
ncbi:MAG: hypothetical protein GPJ54_10210 [Candidatus Heimdallarchaeota archaeon]|nr:hypothetical protein [Candidatus Heimdallarchaeota archaeon]